MTTQKIPVYILENGIGKGGTSKFAITLSEAVQTKFDIILVDFFDEMVENRLKSKKHFSKLIKLIAIPYFMLKYMHKLNRTNRGISLSLNPHYHLINIICSKLTRVDEIVAIHEYPIKYPWLSIIEKYVRIIPLKLCKLLNVTHICTVSKGIKNYICTEYGIDESFVTVIYNPVDLEGIHNKSLEIVDDFFFQDEIPIIISVGNVIPVKGHWHLLRVFDMVCEHIPCKLVICGDTTRDDNYMQYLLGIHDNMKHKENVLFTGWTNNPYKYLKKSSVFVLSSLSEGLPYCLIEALACGCPIVASNCVEGISEILNNGKYGLLSEKLDEKRYSASEPLTHAENDMMEKILYLLENPNVREEFARKGIERAKDFDKEICVKRYIEYFESIN